MPRASCSGRCQAAQPIPTTTLASNGLSTACRRGSAKPRQPGSSPSGPPYNAVAAKTPSRVAVVVGHAVPPARVIPDPENSPTTTSPITLVTGNKTSASAIQPSRIRTGWPTALPGAVVPDVVTRFRVAGTSSHVTTAGRTVAASRPATAQPGWAASSALRHDPESTQIETASTATAMAALLTLRLREVPVARALTTRAASAGP